MTINRRDFIKRSYLGFTGSIAYLNGLRCRSSRERPNIIFIMADDLGYGDLGCYGQKLIKTPHIDAMAAEGTRFTQVCAGSTVCAPSRSVLMTGQHTGHTRVRGNMCKVGGVVGYKGNRRVRRMHLTDEDTTVARVLQKAGYRTCLVGKWHLESYEPTASPLYRGYEEFYGQLMHDGRTGGYFPEKRYHNDKVKDIPENAADLRGAYQPDLCTEETINFINRHKNQSFFLFLSHSSPHDPYVVPDLGIYADKQWREQEKTYAAMITHLDGCIGRVFKALNELAIDERTIVFFCSDNGPRSSSNNAEQTRTMAFFDSNGPLTGYKRDLYEGGIRVPMIVRWPGRVPAGVTSDAVWYFADFVATAAGLAGTEPPGEIDGISIVPALYGQKQQELHDRFLYWEFFERGFQQAVRWGDWKAIRLAPNRPLELYDLKRDLAERHNVAAEFPGVIETIEKYLKTARTESPYWPVAEP